VFDPRLASPGREQPGPRVRVEAAAHLGLDFVLRVAPHEIVLDTEHRWLEAPAALVAATVTHALGPAPAIGLPGLPTVHDVHVALQQFEFDLTGEPKARLLAMVQNTGAGRRGPFAVECRASSRAPEALAQAMAAALQALATWLQSDG
jgi:hypothetical protein